MKISIANEFSVAPGGRRKWEGGGVTGEDFREKFLVPNLEKANPENPLIIDINGVEGYQSSFLDEAFGGLVWKYGYTAEFLRQILKIEADNGYKLYEEVLWDYIDEAVPNSE